MSVDPCYHDVVIGNTSHVRVQIHNFSKKSFTIPAKSSLCDLHPVSLVEYVKSPVPNTDSSSKTTLPSSEKVFDIPDKLDLSHLKTELSGDELRQVKVLLSRYSHVFAKHYLDLGLTDVTRHHINLTDSTSFKEPYRRIPPDMYEESHKANGL